MSAAFLAHLRQNWPLALAVALLVAAVPLVLASGVFPTNQGSIRRADDPVAYWRWMRRLVVLAVLASTVLVGSYWISAT